MVEIILMSKRGAVIAADSSYIIDSQDEEKVFNTYDKIYPILGHDIAVVVSGYNEFQNIPWEVIINMWHKHLPGKLSTLREYVIKFIEHLKNMVYYYIPEEDNSEYLEDITIYIFKHIYKLYSDNGNISSNELLERMDNFIESLKKHKDTLNSHRVYSAMLKNKKVIKDTVLEILDKNDSLKYNVPLNNEFFEKLLEIIYLLSSKNHDHSLPLTTEIIIVGYGKDSIFPSLCSLNIHGYIGDEVIFSLGEGRNISSNKIAHIELYGQNDDIEDIRLFLSGCNTYTLNIQANVLKELLTEKFNELNINLVEQDDTLVDKFVKEYIELFMESCLKKHELPIYQVMAKLPLKDLFNLAESLIDLPILRKKYGLQNETVKTPIDVAIITKNGGFEWVKKK